MLHCSFMFSISWLFTINTKYSYSHFQATNSHSTDFVDQRAISNTNKSSITSPSTVKCHGDKFLDAVKLQYVFEILCTHRMLQNIASASWKHSNIANICLTQHIQFNLFDRLYILPYIPADCLLYLLSIQLSKPYPLSAIHLVCLSHFDVSLWELIAHNARILGFGF